MVGPEAVENMRRALELLTAHVLDDRTLEQQTWIQALTSADGSVAMDWRDPARLALGLLGLCRRLVVQLESYSGRSTQTIIEHLGTWITEIELNPED